ncbi:hypothetical protein ACFY1V_17455 [Streptomyces sp. NPDC001255]|uniref:hypothetical protein n=1 Tax=Streptomyces sp. NPDC001255 TaxID=3364550 RepID=UPI0036CA4261
METARLLFGLSAAVLAPWGLGWQRSRPWSMVAFTAAYGFYVIAPYSGQPRPWFALAGVALLAVAAVFLYNAAGLPSPGFTVTIGSVFSPARGLSRLGAGFLGCAILVSGWVGGARALQLGDQFLLNGRTTVVLSAGLIAVFAGGPLAMLATSGVLRQVNALPASDPERQRALDFMTGGGTIGLLERALLFAFLVAGQPEAAALALTAKSLARGSSDHGKYASEYFLLGTLTSVIAAVVMSMAARSATGLSVL